MMSDVVAIDPASIWETPLTAEDFKAENGRSLEERAAEENFCIQCKNTGFYFKPTKWEGRAPIWESARRVTCPCKQIGAIKEGDLVGEYRVRVTYAGSKIVTVLARNEKHAEDLALWKVDEADCCDLALTADGADVEDGP